MAHDEARRGYPAHWEADVVLRDGVPAHLRPIGPADAEALQELHTGQSERSVYLRFFAPMARLSESDLERFTRVDHRDRVALVVVVPRDGRDSIIAVGRFDRTGPTTAEVAFMVADAHHGRGLGSVLLEHLAAVARELGIDEFTAEVLPQNGAMLAVFREAGYEVSQEFDDGLVAVRVDLDPGERSRDVMADREHRAEARSMRAVWDATSVLVIGPGAAPGLDADRARAVLVAQLAASGTGPRVTALGVDVPESAFADPRLSVAATIDDVAGPVDLAVVALPGPEVLAVVASLARLGVRTLVVLSAGFAEEGPAGLERQRELLRTAHRAGMRVVGPESYGVLRPDDDAGLHFVLAPRVPGPGGVGLFCQSAAVAVRLLDGAAERGLGVSQFLSAGNRADVSGNDVMQFWADDPTTAVAALSLESIGNPRKFVRVARRLARRKPVVVATAGRSGQVVPPGHAVRATSASRRMLEEMLGQSGVLRVQSTAELLDVAQLLETQPVPAGRRVGVVASSHSLAALAVENAAAAGLAVARDAVVLPEDAPPVVVRATLREACGWQDVDALVVVHVPTVPTSTTGFANELALAASLTQIPVVACVHPFVGVRTELTAGGADGSRRTVPSYRSPSDAVGALGHAARYAAWLDRDAGTWARPEGTDLALAGRLVDSWFAEGTAELDAAQVTALLAAVGIEVPGVSPASATGERAGVACVVRSTEDRLFGPVVSFGLAGDASELFGDLAHGIAPLTTGDVAHLVRSVRAAPRLFGYRGDPGVDIDALEDLLARVAVLADALPELAELDLAVTARQGGVVVETATARLAPPDRRDGPARALPS